MIPKFRVFIKFKGVNRMQPVSKIDFDKKEVTIPQGIKLSFDLVELMQHTNYKDMYVGDIVSDEYGNIYEVVFENQMFKAVPKPWKGRKNRYLGEDLKVLGNVWEHPELLEVHN